MFISTVVSSRRLNSTANNGVVPYNFSLPYNFTRGRDLTISFDFVLSAATTNSYHWLDGGNAETIGESGGNTIHVTIPDAVTNYTVSHRVSREVFGLTGQVNGRVWWGIYTLELNFDLVKQTITVTPITFETSNPGFGYDKYQCAPCLINITTTL